MQIQIRLGFITYWYVLLHRSDSTLSPKSSKLFLIDVKSLSAQIWWRVVNTAMVTDTNAFTVYLVRKYVFVLFCYVLPTLYLYTDSGFLCVFLVCKCNHTGMKVASIAEKKITTSAQCTQFFFLLCSLPHISLNHKVKHIIVC